MGPRERSFLLKDTSRSFFITVCVVENEREVFYWGKYGGCSSEVERLFVEQKVAGALPVSHPKERRSYGKFK